MNPTLIKIAQFIARRPKDGTIRLMHILSWFFVFWALWFAGKSAVMDIPFMAVYEWNTAQKIEYGFMIIGLFFILRGILPWCLIRQKTLRILQTTAGFLLIIIGGPIMDPMIQNIIAPPTTTTGGFNIDTTVAPVVQMTWHPGTLLILLWIFWIIVGLTGKGVTEKCIRFGEVVKKIRV